MAIRMFSVCSPSVLTVKKDSDKGPRKSRLIMCADNHVSVDGLQIRSYDHHKIKVFEDRSAGVVCYKDENGEITCEGYDEGPRFHQQISRFSYNSSSRDVEIVDLLQRCWLHVADEDEIKTADKENINCNGIKKLC